MDIVVAGAGHAAIQLAATLRQGGHGGAITLVAPETGLPYQRPPLSKAYLAGELDEAGLALRPAPFFATQRIDLIAGDRVVAIDRAARCVALASGKCLPYGHLVLATGAENRRLDVPGAGLPGVMGLRSHADALALRAKLPSLRRVAVVGAGFIGLEFAAVAAARGIAVTVLEAAPRPLLRGVSATMSAHIAAVHRGWGTRLLTSTGVTAIHGTTHATAVKTDTGEIVPADLVLVAIGVVPLAGLAASAGLAVGNGVLVDEMLRTGDPDISAIGDCACFPLPGQTAPIRLESVQNAADQARAVAERLLGRAAPYAKLPWFWSDQGPLKLQIAGLSAGHDLAVMRGDPAGGAFSVFCFAGGRLVAVESLNRPTDHMLARKLLTSDVRLTPAQCSDLGFDLRQAG